MMQSIDRSYHSRPSGPDSVCAKTEAVEQIPGYELRQGATWARFDGLGDIRPIKGGDFGLYHSGIRYLCQCELFINQQRPVLLDTSLDERRVLFTAELTNPPCYVKKQLIAPSGQLCIRRLMFLWQGCCYTRLVIENQSNAMWEGDCTLWFDADFIEATAASQSPWLRPGRRLRPKAHDNHVWIGHADANGTRRSIRLDFTPTPPDSSSSVVWVVKQLQPTELVTFDLTVTCEPHEDTAPGLAFDQALAAARVMVRK